MNLAIILAIFSYIPGILGSLQRSQPDTTRRRLGDVVNPETAEQFKERNFLREDFDPLVHVVTESSKWVEIDQELIPLEMNELHPINVFSPNARYIFDGEVQDALPPVSIYTSDVDPTVSVSITSKGGLQSITKADPITGEVLTSVLPVEPDSDVFVEVRPEDIDDEELAKHEYLDSGEDSLPPPTRLRRHRKTSESGIIKVPTSPNTPDHNHRHLQACRQYRVIDLAIAYDSTFCRDVGGTEEQANNAVQRIISQVSKMYQQPGLCLKVEIAAMDGNCNPRTDPYASVVNYSVSNMLAQFVSSIRNDPIRSRISRDSFHFFYGRKNIDGRRAVGRAYKRVLCSERWGFGINEVTHSTNPALQANVVAHELGHNAGSDHDTVPGQTVMNEVTCPRCSTFSTNSINQINAHINTVRCISTPEGPTSPTPAPTRAPTRASSSNLTVFSATFDDSQDGFTYVPRAFSGLRGFNSGYYDATAGQSRDGALIISLGDKDKTPIFGVSGSWSIDFVMERSAPTQLSIVYQLEMGADKGNGEHIMAIASVDGTMYGSSPGSNYMSILNQEDRGSNYAPSIQGPYTRVELSLPPTLSVGVKHNLKIGAYLQGRGTPSLYGKMRIDSVVLSYQQS